MVGCVEALDVPNDRTAFLRWRLLAIEILGEADVRPA
jgi:hypothetical protein